ncbi:MAG: UDP-N-acetylmuramoyl-tripeptide--D-alanyl-D-alanine ligase [Acidimicrobiia bacterium]|nr:UDP-N-acetylmuramoyl-tripeptide--D-alanyl-D-alanine ligase [Acidimicrobiia bacterium]
MTDAPMNDAKITDGQMTDGQMTDGVNLGWTLRQMADAVTGDLVGDGDAVVSHVATDSRRDVTGALFVALVGERFDGHAYADQARSEGAVGVLVEAGRGCDVTPRIEVPSTGQALLELAAKRRRELSIPVVAITGSSGKTSTKDLVAAGLPGSWASPRSFNNEIGVPLTVLGTPTGATALILEVGSRGRGHISWLADAVAPDISVVTNLGVVHLETFGSEAGLADAKHELIELLGEGGVAIVPADESRLRRGAAPREITFGDSSADVTYGEVRLDEAGRAMFTITTSAGMWPVHLAVSGAHQAANAAAAVAVAVALDADVGAFIARLDQTTGSQWRMDVHTGRFTVVNDAYNANPQSVEAALRTIVEMPHHKTIAVLGPMAELGHVCESEHRRMGALAVDLGIDEMIVVGPDHGYVLGAGPLVRNAMDSQDAADTLHAIVEPGDVVLVKASRAAGLEHLALALARDAAP